MNCEKANVVSIEKFSKTLDREERVGSDKCFLRKKKKFFFFFFGGGSFFRGECIGK